MGHKYKFGNDVHPQYDNRLIVFVKSDFLNPLYGEYDI